MRWLETVLALCLIVSSQSAELRAKRGADGKKDTKTKKDDKDLKSAETRIPLVPYGGAYDAYDSPVAYGVEPLHGGYGQGIIGAGPYGYGGLIQKPLGIPHGVGYDSG